MRVTGCFVACLLRFQSTARTSNPAAANAEARPAEPAKISAALGWDKTPVRGVATGAAALSDLPVAAKLSRRREPAALKRWCPDWAP